MEINLNIQEFIHRKTPENRTFVIAGPCSVESEEQVMRTAVGLSECNVQVLRGGIWKPRTRPGSFQGVETQGLSWLKNAGLAANLPVTCEVANPEHVEECLEHFIDILWIGARTSVNPFAVQAIADSLKGVDIPVMIKNPINPDIELWIGAFERLNKAGITKLVAIHRGFSSYRKSEYRNTPNWRIPIELKRRVKNLPIICDPSHICGNVELLQSVAQEAMDLLFDGLMIEVHENPKVALSDAKQQITPKQLVTLLDSLKMKSPEADNQEVINKIQDLRKEIDDVDTTIIQLLAKRMGISNEIGTYKRSSNISSFQPSRWEEIIKSRIKAGVEKNLGEEFILRVYQMIHEESIRQQEEEAGI
jgi:chorismate mutase